MWAELSKLQKRLLIIIPTIVIIFFIIYIYQTSQKGIFIFDDFLKQSINGNSKIYSGTIFDENSKITVNKTDNKSTLHIEISDKYQQTYYVVREKNDINDNMIISIYKDDVQLYNGVYTPSSYLISAYQNNNSFDFYVNGHEWGLFELSLNTIAEIALLKATSHMGSWFMFFAILLFAVILIVDICFPLLFFKIKYCLSVKFGS